MYDFWEKNWCVMLWVDVVKLQTWENTLMVWDVCDDAFPFRFFSFLYVFFSCFCFCFVLFVLLLLFVCLLVFFCFVLFVCGGWVVGWLCVCVGGWGCVGVCVCVCVWYRLTKGKMAKYISRTKERIDKEKWDAKFVTQCSDNCFCQTC